MTYVNQKARYKSLYNGMKEKMGEIGVNSFSSSQVYRGRGTVVEFFNFVDES